MASNFHLTHRHFYFNTLAIKRQAIFADSYFNMNFAEKLKTLMKLRGLKQGELSKLSGVSQNAVSKWLSGKAEPSISNTVAVAKALGVTVADLTGEEPVELTSADRKLLALPEDQKELVVKFFEFLKTIPKIGD